jgi:protein-L-isoaspartate(D-aspartate) O-methyltransferase
MVEELVARRAIRSSEWRQAALVVPRHVFIPTIYTDNSGADGITRYTKADPGLSLGMAYQDHTWVTQLDNGASDPEDEPILAAATSSSTAPSAVLEMLEDLEVTDGMRVLELGTGTGYSTALLSARLGASLVTSVEHDNSLSNLARTRLASVGYHPYLLCRDGEQGCAERGPFDRIMVTFSPHHVPMAWVDQAKPGAVILVSLVGSWGAHGYIRLRVNQLGTASGYFQDAGPSFMPSRIAQPPIVSDDLGPLLRAAFAAAENVPPMPVTADPQQFNNPDFVWVAQLALPDVITVTMPTSTGVSRRWFLHADGSWAVFDIDQGTAAKTVRQGGLQKLWSAIESAQTSWQSAGSPKPSRYGLTVAEGVNSVWLDEPTNVIASLAPTS